MKFQLIYAETLELKDILRSMDAYVSLVKVSQLLIIDISLWLIQENAFWF